MIEVDAYDDAADEEDAAMAAELGGGRLKARGAVLRGSGPHQATNMSSQADGNVGS